MPAPRRRRRPGRSPVPAAFRPEPKAEAEVGRVEGKLANASFREKAPAAVVAKEEERLAAARARVDGLRQRLAELE